MFKKIWEKLRAYKTRSEESGSAIVFALVLMIVTFGLVNVVTAFGLSNLNKAVFVQSYTNNGFAAETAIQNAILVANSANGASALRNSLANSQNGANVVKGTVPAEYTNGIGDLKWVWYTQRYEDGSPVAKYYIHGIGYRGTLDDPYARHFRVLIDSKASMKATYDDQITYHPQADAVSQWGILGSSSVKLFNGVNIDSYISDQGLSPSNSTGRAQIASNGVFNVYGNGAVDSLNMLNFCDTASAGNPNCVPGYSNRCPSSYAGCLEYSSISKHSELPYTINLKELAAKVEEKCPLQVYPVWKASENGGVLTAGCYNSLVFDIDTSIPTSASENNPAMVYIKGDIIVEPGVEVNRTNSPMALRIYSQGGKNALFKGGTLTNQTKFSGYVAGGVFTCTDGSDPSTPPQAIKNIIYGSLACDQIVMGGGTQIWWDELSADLSSSGGNVRRLWYPTTYEEIY